MPYLLCALLDEYVTCYLSLSVYIYICIYLFIYMYIFIHERVVNIVVTRILLIIGASRRPGKEPQEASVQKFSKLSPGKWNSPLYLLDNCIPCECWITAYLELNHPLITLWSTLEFNNTFNTWIDLFHLVSPYTHMFTLQ